MSDPRPCARCGLSVEALRHHGLAFGAVRNHKYVPMTEAEQKRLLQMQRRSMGKR